MPGQVKPIPEGYHTVTPSLVVNDGPRALDFYKRAFGAQERFRMEGPPGKIGHAEIKIGDSMIMLSDEFPGMGARSPLSLGGSPVTIFLYVNDVDTAFKQAVDAGAKVEMPLADMFWGDRFGRVSDPFGHLWAMATHKEDLSPEEVEKRAKVAMAQMSQQTKTAT